MEVASGLKDVVMLKGNVSFVPNAMNRRRTPVATWTVGRLRQYFVIVIFKTKRRITRI